MKGMLRVSSLDELCTMIVPKYKLKRTIPSLRNSIRDEGAWIEIEVMSIRVLKDNNRAWLMRYPNNKPNRTIENERSFHLRKNVSSQIRAKLKQIPKLIPRIVLDNKDPFGEATIKVVMKKVLRMMKKNLIKPKEKRIDFLYKIL